jgi:hypothetical protein
VRNGEGDVADVKNVVAMKAAVGSAWRVALASGRWSSPSFGESNKLNADQINALIAAGGNPAAGGRGGAGRGGFLVRCRQAESVRWSVIMKDARS